MIRGLLILAWLASSVAAYADRVMKIQSGKKLAVVVFSEGKNMRPDDNICLKIGEVSVACGEIFTVSPKGAIVYLYYGIENLYPGLEVELIHQTASPRSRILTAGLNFKSPEVQLQQLFSSRTAYGLMAEGINITNGNLSMKGFVTMMTFSYYGDSTFKGFWAMMGLGLHILNRQEGASEANRSSVTSLVGLATIGWRFRFSNFSLGFAGGGQYFLDKAIHDVTGNGGILPSAIAEVGFLF